jgi:hypothetical protein
MVGVVTKPDAEVRELVGGTDGVGFDAAVAQIANVAAEAEALGFGDGEETEADSLHAAGDEEASCFFCVVHKL